MQNLAIAISYDGTKFHGFQSRTGMRSVQNELIKALETVLRCKLGSFSPSGRTDRNVTAYYQICTFLIDDGIVFEPRKVGYAVSSLLKSEIQLFGIRVMPPEFHARHSGHSKQYSYRIFNHPSPPARTNAWHISGDLNLQDMQRASALFEGRHDYQAFRHAHCAAKSTLRTVIVSEVTKEGHEIIVRVVGKGFLMHMVRIMAGTLVDVGHGKTRPEDIKKLLTAETKRVEAGITAPGAGLTLDWISYDDLEYKRLLGEIDIKCGR